MPKAVMLTGPFGDPERVIELPRPTTIADIIASNDLQFRLPTIAVMDGKPVLRKEWPTRQISEDIMFVAMPGQSGGSGSGKQIIGLIAGIALAVAAPMVGAWAAGAFFGGSAIASSLISGLVLPAGSLTLDAKVFS